MALFSSFLFRFIAKLIVKSWEKSFMDIEQAFSLIWKANQLHVVVTLRNEKSSCHQQHEQDNGKVSNADYHSEFDVQRTILCQLGATDTR